VVKAVAVEKLDFPENWLKTDDQKCIRIRRKSFIGHPGATILPCALGERVFQQPRLFAIVRNYDLQANTDYGLGCFLLLRGSCVCFPAASASLWSFADGSSRRSARAFDVCLRSQSDLSQTIEKAERGNLETA
jgi:hypothetical protein